MADPSEVAAGCRVCMVLLSGSSRGSGNRFSLSESVEASGLAPAGLGGDGGVGSASTAPILTPSSLVASADGVGGGLTPLRFPCILATEYM